jgi:ChpA-C
VKLRTRVAGVSAATATAAAVAMMGPSAVAQSAPFSILSGNRVNALLSVPVNVCGVVAGILAFADAGCFDG